MTRSQKWLGRAELFAYDAMWACSFGFWAWLIHACSKNVIGDGLAWAVGATIAAYISLQAGRKT